MRHAHAEWPGYAGEDFDRPLTARGLAEAVTAARAMRTAGQVPDSLLVSPARRTRQTAEIVARELGLPPTALQFEDALYNATASALAREMQRHASGGLVLLVAHNPGISSLARQLSEDPHRPPFPPAGWDSFRAPAGS
jgi:phosphohistidine phosphatase